MNQNYLLETQYKNSGNLDARINLHALFSTNKYGWHKWVFDHFDFPPQATILELGSGSGELWKQNIHRISRDWDIALSDFSSGMLKQTQKNLAHERTFKFNVIDTQEIPFDNARFDAVIANHMLYHIPKLDEALAEIYRILKPQGRFYAATNGLNHLRELDALAGELGYPLPKHASPAIFSLENGYEKLSKPFKRVQLLKYADSLVITAAVPLVDYMQSMLLLSEDGYLRLKKHIESKLEEGPICITKDVGLFIAKK